MHKVFLCGDNGHCQKYCNLVAQHKSLTQISQLFSCHLACYVKCTIGIRLFTNLRQLVSNCGHYKTAFYLSMNMSNRLSHKPGIFPYSVHVRICECQNQGKYVTELGQLQLCQNQIKLFRFCCYF